MESDAANSQGVINDYVVWAGHRTDRQPVWRLINTRQVRHRMTHTCCRFHDLRLFRDAHVTSYLRAAKSLGATNWRFWRGGISASVLRHRGGVDPRCSSCRRLLHHAGNCGGHHGNSSSNRSARAGASRRHSGRSAGGGARALLGLATKSSASDT